MAEDREVQTSRDELLRMSAEIVSAYVSNNSLASSQLPEAIKTVFGALTDLASGSTPTVKAPEVAAKPAVSVKKSIMPDYIVCLEDGKKLKMLKRYLRTNFQMTPEQYREKWGLPADYPMVAPNYAKQRSQFAKDIGLGRKAGKRKR